jgi:hypothetical protein
MATPEVEASSAPQQAYSDAPAFPDNVPTAPLLRLSLAKLLDRNPAEVKRFINACEDLGFFYLDLSGPGDPILADADQLFKVGEELFELPLEEKKQYDFSEKKSYFGYKGYGAMMVDRSGNLDRNEFYNVSVGTVLQHLEPLTSSRYPRMISLELWTLCRLLNSSARSVLSYNPSCHQPMAS